MQTSPESELTAATIGRGGDTAVPHAVRAQPRARLGDIVVELGFCERDVVEAAVQTALDSGEQIGQVLLERGAITTDQLAVAMAKRFGLDHLSLEDITVDPVAAHMVSFAAARRMRVVPVSVASGNVLLVAIANPENYLGLDDISMFTGMQIKPVVVSQEDLDTLLKRLSVLDGEGVEDELASEPRPQ